MIYRAALRPLARSARLYSSRTTSSASASASTSTRRNVAVVALSALAGSVAYAAVRPSAMADSLPKSPLDQPSLKENIHEGRAEEAIVAKKTPQVVKEKEAESTDVSQGAFNPETGEINWDCPCLGGMSQGPCGEDFKAAFSCFVFSEAEPKGMDCVDKFKSMQDCFRAHPDVYGEEIEDEESSELGPSPLPNPDGHNPATPSGNPPANSAAAATSPETTPTKSTNKLTTSKPAL